jgi:sarcosine oxidase
VSGAHRLEASHLVADARADVADVAIVGLGAMGALSAWRLAAAGARVIGFEQFRPGHDRGSSHGDTRIFRTAYFEGPDYVPLLQRAHRLWRQLEDETGAELLTMTGGLAIGRLDGELVSGVLASARANQLPHSLLTTIETGRLYPQHRLDAGEGAVLDEQAGFLRPERAVAAAASRAEALGARLLAETQVKSIDASSGSVVIETSRGRFAAERVLVTAGPWTSKLLPDLALPLQVERQVMAWMTVDDPALFAPQRFPIFIREVAAGRFRYGFPSTDGRSIKLAVHHDGTGTEPDSIDRNVVEADLAPIRDFARQSLRGVTGEVVDARVCMYTNTPDERFLATSPAGMPGVTVLSACSGHGFKFAPVMGELMADLILDAHALPAIVRTA